MISYIDIIFIALTAVLLFLSIRRGFLVSVLSTVRFIVIVPSAYFLGNYLSDFIPKGFFGTLPVIVDKVIVCVLSFIALMILSSLLLSILKHLQNKKGMPLRHTNAFLGALLGLVKACVLILGVCTALGYVVDFIPKDNAFYQAIDSSYIVSFVNEHNVFLNI